MAKIKIKACGYSMEASGNDKFVSKQREAFFRMITGNVGRAIENLYTGGIEKPIHKENGK